MTKLTKQEIINVKCDGCRSLITNYDPNTNKTKTIQFFTLIPKAYHEDPSLKHKIDPNNDRDFCPDCEWNIQELIKTGIRAQYFKQVIESDTFKKILKKQKDDDKKVKEEARKKNQNVRF